MLNTVSGQTGNVSISRASSIEPSLSHALREKQIMMEELSTSGTNAVACTPESYLEVALTNRSTLPYNMSLLGCWTLHGKLQPRPKVSKSTYRVRDRGFTLDFPHCSLQYLFIEARSVNTLVHDLCSELCTCDRTDSIRVEACFHSLLLDTTSTPYIAAATSQHLSKQPRCRNSTLLQSPFKRYGKNALHGPVVKEDASQNRAMPDVMAASNVIEPAM